jgi:hypothetical protein
MAILARAMHAVSHADDATGVKLQCQDFVKTLAVHGILRAANLVDVSYSAAVQESGLNRKPARLVISATYGCRTASQSP